MSIPDFQSLMYPVLAFLADGKTHTSGDIVDALAKQLRLSDKELHEMLPSETQPVFSNRIGWAKSYMKKAGLMISPKRGLIEITDLGLEVIKSGVKEINSDFLMRFSGFVEFRNIRHTRNRGTVTAVDQPLAIDYSTPEEILESTYQNLTISLSQDLLDKILTLHPSFFEKLVIELLVKMGYGGSLKDAGKAIGKSNDEGIDGIIKEDKLGLDIIYVQAKRWDKNSTIGRPEIQKFVGALAGKRARKGIFITTSKFSNEARSYPKTIDTKVVLIDGQELAQLMIEHDLGVSIQRTYQIKRIDSDYFEAE